MYNIHNLTIKNMFLNILKRTKLIDRELKLYRSEEILKIDEEVRSYWLKRQIEIQKIAKQCNEEIAQYEHAFHHTTKIKSYHQTSHYGT